MDEMLVTTVEAMLDGWDTEATRAGDRRWASDLWGDLLEAGFPWVSVPEAVGGMGGTLGDAAAINWLIGSRAAPVPVAETGMLAGWMLAEAGLEVPMEPLTVGCTGAPLELRSGAGAMRISGEVHRVPWAHEAGEIVILAEDRGDGTTYVVALDRASVEVAAGRSLAGEGRDTVVCRDVAVAPDRIAPAPASVTIDTVRFRGALVRSVLIAGALERVSSMTVAYANERHQFGKPIASFQAVASMLVRIAAEAELAGLATLRALREPWSSFDVAAAKALTSEAAGTVARLAHQAHGAIGMTDEFELGHLTRRLWTWRQEFGSARYWQERLGREVLRAGADELWPRLTDSHSATVYTMELH